MNEPPIDTHPDASELRAALHERIAAGVAAPVDDAEMTELARAVFAHQFAGNRPYRLFCERRGVTPARVGHWTEVPAVPTDAFKAAPLVVGGPAGSRAVFRTSGTTQGRERRGEHWFRDLSLYDAALRAGWRAHVMPDGGPMPVLSLVPDPAQVPDSSLSHMAGEVMRDFGAEGSGWFVDTAGGIDAAGLSRALRRAEEVGRPVCLVGTAFAFVHWLDALRGDGASFRLPAGSRVMDTGGFKGRSREVTRGELYAGIADRLGIGAAWCVNEYGMTEMSSQFYDAVAGRTEAPPAERTHVGPGWVRTRASDPETLALLPHGEMGVLRHWDLANLDSVSCIQTADLGFTTPEGFRVVGRATGAEARGCSLAMDELLSAIRR